MRAKAWRKPGCMFAMASILVMVLVASGGYAVASTIEICTTPTLPVSVGDQVACRLNSAWAYGPIDILKLDIIPFPNSGSLTLMVPLGLLGVVQIAEPVAVGHDGAAFVCRWTVSEPVAGYVRATISKIVGGVDIPGYVATCNPF